MEFELWRSMISFAREIESWLADGWHLSHDFGEEKFGIPDKMVFTKGEKCIVMRSLEDFEYFSRKAFGKTVS